MSILSRTSLILKTYVLHKRNLSLFLERRLVSRSSSVFLSFTFIDFLFKMIVKTLVSQLLLLLVFYDHATSLIIPEELPTILSLIYSNISPIKKGTDSRFGVGFRLGEHADFQILIELGPQTETDPIGTSNDAKRRRDAMINAAMKGELGPLAQTVAKYQINRKIQKEMDELKIIEEKIKKIKMENIKAHDVSKKFIQNEPKKI
ncbi:PREDICTED: uncharacterized protein LOC108763987 isoform X1 [Trachymyrmex cornetzi]|uniref:uncharacterized protein LOC108763987 isoform X1 n=1 Tax=Trachymyrmex cornetzi TaxID=471704 RepID=UPI00084F3BE8|nr:PREDICTED: uncharacterized protein LOC108763987 isoform X1 [Trachymyrmex cornetzi]